MKKQKPKFSPALSNEDRQIWRKVSDTAIPLDSGARNLHSVMQELFGDQKTPAPFPAKSKTQSSALTMPIAEPVAVRSAPVTQDIDTKTRRKISKGGISLERRLDLHGFTQDQAHIALENFLYKAVQSGARTALIITGKGNFGQGVLKNNVPRWLASPSFAQYVSAFGPSAGVHGGEGALYVRLRKQKPDQGR